MTKMITTISIKAQITSDNLSRIRSHLEVGEVGEMSWHQRRRHDIQHNWLICGLVTFARSDISAKWQVTVRVSAQINHSHKQPTYLKPCLSWATYGGSMLGSFVQRLVSQDRLPIEPSFSLSLSPTSHKCRLSKCRFAQISLNLICDTQHKWHSAQCWVSWRPKETTR